MLSRQAQSLQPQGWPRAGVLWQVLQVYCQDYREQRSVLRWWWALLMQLLMQQLGLVQGCSPCRLVLREEEYLLPQRLQLGLLQESGSRLVSSVKRCL